MYVPDREILQKYANLLVHFALNSGRGVRKGEVVMIAVPDVAKPLLVELQKAVLVSGAHPILRLLPTGTRKDFYELSSDEQLTFFAARVEKAQVDLVDHSIYVIAEHDLREMKTVDPYKIMKWRNARTRAMNWTTAKENQGKYTWTIAAYATAAMAREAKLTLEQYWAQIIKGCYLDVPDPIVEWRRIFVEQARIKKRLNKLEIERLHVEAQDIDLWLTIGAERAWNGGKGRNIPSFEIFTSPDWRGAEGRIKFNQPLYQYGNLIEEVWLEFKNGVVVNSGARKGEKFLQAMLQTKDADKLGEFSLTDRRFSRIDKFMANTLFDENLGGRYGNTHIAIGRAYRDCYKGDVSKVTEAQWAKMGYNNSPEHTDIISTQDRTVTAIWKTGRRKVIYRDGQFVI